MSTHTLPRRRGLAALLALVLVPLGASGCSTPRIDLTEWRAQEVRVRPAEARGDVATELARVDTLREARDLAGARTLALQLAAERPEDGAAQLLASRAESDGMLLAAAADKHTRNHCAASALDHAERAAALGVATPAARAQLAWALGTTTHLQGMTARSAHARRTMEVAEGVLADEPRNPTAAATLAIVHLRLETLPWIAQLMARSRPDSSLEEAERLARIAVDAAPSREHRLVLAKVLRAADRGAEARGALEAALAAPPRYPRDDAVEAEVRALLDEL
jgi:hypothetical protein